jgi:hypothetical protein
MTAVNNHKGSRFTTSPPDLLPVECANTKDEDCSFLDSRTTDKNAGREGLRARLAWLDGLTRHLHRWTIAATLAIAHQLALIEDFCAVRTERSPPSASVSAKR